MKYVDIAIAILIGVSALAGLLVTSPQAGDGAARVYRLKTALRDRLTAYAGARGAAWFLQTPVPEICSQLEASSNSSFALSATIGSVECGPRPPMGSVAVNLSLLFLPFPVTLEAWSAAGA